MENTQVILQSRPQGMVSEDNFKIKLSEVSAPKEGELLIKVEYISLDPAIRGWMNEGTTYIKGVELGAPMRVFAAGKVTQSNHPDFQIGDYVSGLMTAQEYIISNGVGLSKLDLSNSELSWHLGILGMPGMTAYFGLLERGKPEQNDVVLVSGAAGIVGSTVGQIAKIKGCKVIGTAGSDAKCKYLVEECNFDAAINYKTENIDASLKKYAPEGVHIYYDNVGGEMLDIALANLARGARVVICGAISQYNAKEMYGPKNYMKIVTARGSMTGVIVFDFLDKYPEAVTQISEWLKKGQMKTKEDIFEGIENFPQVLMKLYTGQNFGKLLLKV